MDKFFTNCKEQFKIGRDTAINEQTVTCKSRYTNLTHLNKNMPAGQGFKIYLISKTATGYIKTLNAFKVWSLHQLLMLIACTTLTVLTGKQRASLRFHAFVIRSRRVKLLGGSIRYECLLLLHIIFANLHQKSCFGRGICCLATAPRCVCVR